MSLARCRECKKEISTEAAACPHCGCPKPVPPRTERPGAASASLLITLGVVGALVIFMAAMNPSKPLPIPPTPPAKAAQPAPAAPPKPPPTAAQIKARDQVAQINSDNFCAALGRALRNPKANTPDYLDEMIARAINRENMTHEMLQGIRERRPVLNMDTCAVLAALGRPNRSNRSVGKHMESYQLVYSDRGIYVYLDNGVVTHWQD